ncbi:iron complex transport system substrate-binding protein [Microbispora rosea]|uniref:Iron complex transport system substrate-binding protein n=1 Tax=Microbispora rosea TaxID=58117 RepID=A0A1N7BWM3_9ACTN|nr:iron-siderophore ABC transporter substrate-binding protein [Microbispora rosea]GIH52207.1 ABC transporter periplasmic component [Microbispora rosea subsp. rosea]SIR55767.1 iron complex transport system substrate-binding protein [Microbispora rosea]
MSLRHRGIGLGIGAVAVALSLVGCGASSGTGTGAGKPAAEAAQKAVAKGGADFGTAAEKTAAMGTTAKPGEWPRTITHAMGTTEIKAQPTRVVVLDVGELDNVVSLGVKPVGFAPSEGSPELPSYLKQDAGTPQNIGTINNLNLEAIAGLHPDLILGSQLRAAEQYDELSKIAPTVFSIRPGFTWKENYLLNAAALDKTEEAKAKLAEYDRKVKDLGAKLGDHKPVVSMVRFMPNGVIRLYANASFIGTILKDAGIPRPANQDIPDLAAEVSAENIDQADADVIFTGVYGDPKATDKSAVQGNPLWANLKAVKAGHAYEVPDETWYLGLGVTAAMEVVGDLERYLAG